MVLTGVAVGIFSGLFGIGGGTIAIPALVLLFSFNQQTAQGTSLLMMVPTALMGAATYWRHQSLNPLAALALMIGGVASAHLGARLALTLPQAQLRVLFAFFLVIVAVRMMPRGNVGSMGAIVGMVLIAAGLRFVTAR
jgi:hypothetical protein